MPYLYSGFRTIGEFLQKSWVFEVRCGKGKQLFKHMQIAFILVCAIVYKELCINLCHLVKNNNKNHLSFFEVIHNCLLIQFCVCVCVCVCVNDIFF
jgi:hypothetical protein